MSIPAAFVHLPGHLTMAGGGGVQICTREYYVALQHAGFSLRPIELHSDRRFIARVKRRVRPNPYGFLDERGGRAELTARLGDAEYVFLNLRNVGAAADWIRQVRDRCRIVMLSHGLESTDYLQVIERDARSGKRLGRLLLSERAHNALFDHIFCISPIDADLETWLGGRASWLPRTVSGRALVWTPITGRIGYVGTLDHAPNRDGLVRFLEAVSRSNARDVSVRVVGTPRREGEAIAARFAHVDYIGSLSDDLLEKEAATWACFVHPLFVCARGCSTKIAIALGWNIPVATTTLGLRGYTWKDGSIPTAESAEALATLAVSIAQSTNKEIWREQVARAAKSTPRIDEIAARIRRDLQLDGPNPRPYSGTRHTHAAVGDTRDDFYVARQ